MKKLNFSLIAALCVASNVSAAPLEDAIKDIDISGFGRYRYESAHEKDKRDGHTFGSSTDAFHRFTLDVNFKSTLDDNFFAFIGVRYDTIDVSGSGVNFDKKGISNTHGGLAGINGTWGSTDSLSIREYYAGYKGIPNTLITFGRGEIGSFFTDDVVGTGLKVLNNSIEGLSLKASAFDNIEEDGDIGDFLGGDAHGNGFYQNNLYDFSASYANEWLNAGASYAHLQNVANLWAFDLGADYAISDDFSVRGRVNVAGSHFIHQMHKAYNPMGEGSQLANSIFVGAELGFTYDFISLDAGYISFGKKNKFGFNTIEDNGIFISSGENVLDYTYFEGKHDVWFAKVNFAYDAYSLGLDYTHDKEKNDGISIKTDAFTIRSAYKYSDKLNFEAWYEIQNTWRNAIKEKDNIMRIEARYNF